MRSIYNGDALAGCGWARKKPCGNRVRRLPQHGFDDDINVRKFRKVGGGTDLKVMLKAGFGFGDVNACLVFRKWEA